MKATRPKEYICLLPVSVSTALDGSVYTFFAVDTFSKFIVNTGTERTVTKEIILKHIQALLDNKDFRKNPIKKFTIVLGSGEEWRKEIEALIAPHGKMIVDKGFVQKETAPILEEFFKRVKPPPSTLN